MNNKSTVSLEKFELAAHILGATATVENIAIDSLVTADKVVQNFITDIISSSVPNILMTEDSIVETWEHARNRDQKIIDWFMNTYRRISLASGTEYVLDSVRESYSNSIFIGDITELYGDEDLGSRICKEPTQVKDVLCKHRWAITIMALFSIDFDEVDLDEASRTKATS